jgi:hypothetical protein
LASTPIHTRNDVSSKMLLVASNKFVSIKCPGEHALHSLLPGADEFSAGQRDGDSRFQQGYPEANHAPILRYEVIDGCLGIMIDFSFSFGVVQPVHDE